MFCVCSFLLSYSIGEQLAQIRMTEMQEFAVAEEAIIEEQTVRVELSRLLTAAVAASGRTRCEIARAAGIHKDAFRRVLGGTRAATLGEVTRILTACGLPPQPHLHLLLSGQGERGIAWIGGELAHFLDEFACELPAALERVLGNQLHEVKARWARGTAHRVAKLLSDHMDELERRDSLYLESRRP
jgi:DNA-binding phage protein